MWQCCRQCGKFTNLARENTRQLERNSLKQFFIPLTLTISWICVVSTARDFVKPRSMEFGTPLIGRRTPPIGRRLDTYVYNMKVMARRAHRTPPKLGFSGGGCDHLACRIVVTEIRCLDFVEVDATKLAWRIDVAEIRCSDSVEVDAWNFAWRFGVAENSKLGF